MFVVVSSPDLSILFIKIDKTTGGNEFCYGLEESFFRDKQKSAKL